MQESSSHWPLGSGQVHMDILLAFKEKWDKYMQVENGKLVLVSQERILFHSLELVELI